MTAESTVEEIKNAGGDVLGAKLDVSDLASLQQMAASVNDAGAHRHPVRRTCACL
jgi:NAD(P)-dependent dehydrogenase (short-subunit alcohol dehydrogenase family)